MEKRPVYLNLNEESVASPTGPAVMYREDSIKIELAGDVVERAA